MEQSSSDPPAVADVREEKGKAELFMDEGEGAKGEAVVAKLTQERLAPERAYGVLAERARPSWARLGDDEIRERPLRKRWRPLRLGGMSFTGVVGWVELRCCSSTMVSGC